MVRGSAGFPRVRENHPPISSPMETQAVIEFNGWFSFSDLNNFNSEKLIANLTEKDDNGLPFLWDALGDLDSLPRNKNNGKCILPNIALRQAEALFNLSQLMFALYHGSLSACTFLDLQWNNLPSDIRQRGFKKLDDLPIKTGSSYRTALHSLCWDITENGGLPVIFSMIKNPAIPIVQQKCLDALTNILCVDYIEKIVLIRQPWFFHKLIELLKTGNLQSDMVPSISVIDRLTVVMLSDERFGDMYNVVLIDDLVQVVIGRLQDTSLNSNEQNRHHFLKFQTIAMQAIALLCHDRKSLTWQDKTRDLAFNHAYRCFRLWDAEHPPSDPKWHKSENFYKNMSFCSSTLLFCMMVIIHAALKWPGKREYLQSQGLSFKLHLSKMMKAVKISKETDTCSQSVACSFEWLWAFLYDDSKASELQHSSLTNAILDPLSELRERVVRKCSVAGCSRTEKKPNTFTMCGNCSITCYCSVSCQREHREHQHTNAMCKFLSMETN